MANLDQLASKYDHFILGGEFSPYFPKTVSAERFEFAKKLKDVGKDVLMMSTNDNMTKDQYAQNLGADPSTVYTASYVGAKYLKQLGVKKVRVVGMDCIQ